MLKIKALSYFYCGFYAAIHSDVLQLSFFPVTDSNCFDMERVVAINVP